jgi:FKBP-type peptidyl-prolyl cis-trans isomerase
MSSRFASVSIALALAGALGACTARTHASDTPAQAAGPDAQAAKAATDFMAKVAKQPGVTVLPDGLAYRIERSGPKDQPSPKVGDEVKVHYSLALIDGTAIESTYDQGEPAILTLGRLIPAWDEALQKMRPGDVWYLYIPPNLGYGDRPSGPIPPGSVLVFKLELLGVLPRGGGSARG